MNKKEFRIWMEKQLRRCSYRWPERNKCLKEAQVPVTKYNKDGTKSKRRYVGYVCVHCKEIFTKRKIQVDHIDPVIDPKKGFKDWNEMIKRMFVKKEKLQCLCAKCHRKKTNKENEERRKK